MRSSRIAAATILAAGLTLTGGTFAQEIKVGAVLALTGPNASLGIPYSQGLKAALPDEIDGHKVNLILLDDASDPSTAVRNTQKLISEDKVDVVIGSSNTPAIVAMAGVTNSAKVPHIAVAPVSLTGEKADWLITIVQPPEIFILPIAKDMKDNGAKRIAFIGFSDPWGDLGFNAIKGAAPKFGLEMVAEERYARSDTSVSGQVLKVMAAKPDAIFFGTSGTPGTLPHIALAERGYKGRQYDSPGVFNQAFLRLGGKSVEGVIAVTGPFGVVEQLPDSNPMKKVGLEFTQKLKAAFNTPANGFHAFAHDAAVVFAETAKLALKSAKPGTPEFRTALRDSFYKVKDVVGTMGIFNFKPGTTYGVDERSVVLVRVENGDWKLMQ